MAKIAGLVVHEPLKRPAKNERCILCPPDVDRILSGNDRASGLPSLGIALIIGQFVAGHVLTISRKKRERKLFKRRSAPELERLEGIDEVWVLCYRTPRPGWRVLGRFLERDVLVLFRVKHKDDIGNDYGPAAAEVISDWIAHFQTAPPCSGTWPSAYLSGTHYDEDTGTLV